MSEIIFATDDQRLIMVYDSDMGMLFVNRDGSEINMPLTYDYFWRVLLDQRAQCQQSGTGYMIHQDLEPTIINRSSELPDALGQ